MSAQVIDVVIAGAGPVGLSLARALSVEGLSVTVVDPEPERAWPNRYAAWKRDLDAANLGAWASATWSQVMVRFASGERTLPGSYVQVDRAGLQRALTDELTKLGATFVTGAACTVEHLADHSMVTLADGVRLLARLVVDATGAGVLMTRRHEPRAFQVAYGELVRVNRHPWHTDCAMLMDFSVGHLSTQRTGDAPTFLYALPQSEHVVFVEETSLAARPGVPLAALKRRLHARLRHLDIEVIEVLEVERCVIPLDGSRPDHDRTVAVGAAAGWVHPATGYQFTRALRTVPAVSQAIVRGLARHPRVAARLAQRASWPTALKATRRLHEIGLSVLLDLDEAHADSFFDAFFALPERQWRAYFDAMSPPTHVAGAMAKLFSIAPGTVRTQLVSRVLLGGRTHFFATTPQSGGPA